MAEKFVKYSLYFIAFLINLAGIFFISIYLKSEVTIWTVLIGLLGFYILYPSLEAWRERLESFFIEEETEDK